MRLFCKLLVAGSLILPPSAASAITLTNHDSTEQKLTVIEGDKQTDLAIKAGEKLQLCEKSCVIRMPDGEDYEFDGPEIVSLEEGLLYLDNPEDQDKTAR